MSSPTPLHFLFGPHLKHRSFSTSPWLATVQFHFDMTVSPLIPLPPVAPFWGARGGQKEENPQSAGQKTVWQEDPQAQGER